MSAPHTPDDIRQAILDAALKRFEHYGYRKTTMADIAEDCGMSAANLYRYFDNKEDICAACARHCMGERAALLREAVRRPGRSAARKLEDFVLIMVRYNHDSLTQQPRMRELVDAVMSERPDVVRAKLDEETALLAEVLAQGNAAGEFGVADVIDTAKTVQAAFVLFDAPLFVGLYDQEFFERKAADVVALLVKGLAPR